MATNIEIKNCEQFFKNRIEWYFPRRSDLGCRYEVRISINALRRLRKSGPWW